MHFHFQLVQRGGFRCGTVEGHGFAKSENGISVCTKEYDSMNGDTRELAADFDLEKLTPEFYADPYPTYRALREHEPVSGCRTVLFLTRYADLVGAYKNTKTVQLRQEKEFGPKYGDRRCSSTTPPAWCSTTRRVHTRVRRLIIGRVVAAGDAEIEPELVALVDRLLDAIAAKGRFDLIEDYAAAIPIEVIGNLLGVPHERTRAVARMVAGHPRRAGAGDHSGRVCARQRRGEGFLGLAAKAGRARGAPSPAIPSATC